MSQQHESIKPIADGRLKEIELDDASYTIDVIETCCSGAAEQVVYHRRELLAEVKRLRAELEAKNAPAA
jgi:hypothetical protein